MDTSLTLYNREFEQLNREYPPYPVEFTKDTTFALVVITALELALLATASMISHRLLRGIAATVITGAGCVLNWAARGMTLDEAVDAMKEKMNSIELPVSSPTHQEEKERAASRVNKLEEIYPQLTRDAAAFLPIYQKEVAGYRERIGQMLEEVGDDDGEKREVIEEVKESLDRALFQLNSELPDALPQLDRFTFTSPHAVGPTPTTPKQDEYEAWSDMVMMSALVATMFFSFYSFSPTTSSRLCAGLLLVDAAIMRLIPFAPLPREHLNHRFAAEMVRRKNSEAKADALFAYNKEVYKAYDTMMKPFKRFSMLLLRVYKFDDTLETIRLKFQMQVVAIIEETEAQQLILDEIKQKICVIKQERAADA